MPVRRTKIVATLGPASAEAKTISALITAGVDVVRLNQSHGERAWHERAFRSVRAAAKRLGKPVAIMVDLQGPKMRIGRVTGGGVNLKRGSRVKLVAGAGLSDENTLYVPLAQIVEDIKRGDRVLLDDGNIALKVISKAGDRAACRVVTGGRMSDHKGVNLPGVDISVPSVTRKDLADLAWAARMGAEYAAVSFVRRPEDVKRVRAFLKKTRSPIRIIAKIEKPEALGKLDEIARLSDGLMVARGDLGVEMPLEKVPVAQERIIAAAHEHDIPVIVATQMLESMTEKPRPTRAEVSDVAAAILGSTDAIMLSGETAIGRYPVKVVRQMASIATEIEKHMIAAGTLNALYPSSPTHAVTDAVCHGACSAARDLRAKAVFVSTTSGQTALLFSKYRFDGLLVGASNNPDSVRRMALHWGVKPLVVRKCHDHHRLLDEITKKALARKLVAPGDTVVFLAGTPLGKSGATNLLIVHRIPPPGRKAPRAKAAGKGTKRA